MVVVAATLALMAPALIAPPHATPTAAPKENGKATADKKERGRERHPPPPPASTLRKLGIHVPTVVVATMMPAPATNGLQTRNQNPQDSQTSHPKHPHR
jgi:hypothetical protein